jgi:hypothetical protein
VHLKTRLGDVETDCLNCLHVWLLSIVGGLNSTHIHGTRAPVEEPSTASKADMCDATSGRVSFFKSPGRKVLGFKHDVAIFNQARLTQT